MSERIDGKQTVEDALARRVADRRGVGSPWAERLRELGAVDRAVYEAVAVTPTPHLDITFRRLSKAANYSRLWLGMGAAIATLGGERGRRVALEGVLAIGATSATVNLGIKPLAHRRRPERPDPAPFEARLVPMPESTSSRPATPRRPSRSPTPWGGTTRGWQCRSGCSPVRWPTRESTPGCTTRVMWSWAPSSEPERRPWWRPHATANTNRPGGKASYSLTTLTHSRDRPAIRSSVTWRVQAR